MKSSFVLITNRKKLLICLAALIFIILAAMLISSLNFPAEAQNMPTLANISSSIESQNIELEKMISSIFPSENKIYYEDNRRKQSVSAARLYQIAAAQASEVLTKGRNLEYITVFSDEDYLRPIYSSSWKQAYFRGWLYLPNKVMYSRHTLFTYTGGPSNIFDIEGELGFYPNISIDTQNHYNFLIYNFDLQNVTQLENQIIISGITVKKGVQIISIKAEDVTVGTDNPQNIIVQLCTPSGYEIDYQYVSLNTPTTSENDTASSQVEIRSTENGMDSEKQNQLLQQELAYFISKSNHSIYFQHNGSYMTSNVLTSNIDLDEAFEYSKHLGFSLSYDNARYSRPIYHPLWKQNYDKEWCYIPRKMYLNMKRLFVLPSDKEVASDLCGELGFFEDFPESRKDQITMLVYNFSVDQARIYENNILLTGTPSRYGAQVVNIPKSKLDINQEYAVRLVTRDSCEIDLDVISP